MKHEQNKETFDYAAFCKIERYDERTRRVLGYLSFRNDGYTDYKKAHKGFFFVSNEELTTACEIGSVHTLNCIIKLLVDDGMILKQSGNNHRCNSYKLTNRCTAELTESQRNAVVHTKLHTKPCNELNINTMQECTPTAHQTAHQTAEQTENERNAVSAHQKDNCTVDIDIDKEIEIGKEKEIEKLRKENTKMKEEIVELSKRVETLTATVESLKGIFEKLNATLGNMEGFAPVSALPTSQSTIENNFEGGFAPITVQGYEKDSKRALWDDWNGFADRIKCTGFEDGDSEKYQLFARRIAALYNDDTAERSKRLHSIQSQWRKLRADAECGLIETHTTPTTPTTPQQTPNDKAIEAIADLRRRWDDYKQRYARMNDADRRSQYYTMRGQIEALPCHPSLKPEITATLDAEYQELLKGTYTADPTPSNIPPTGTDSDDLPF